MRIRSLITRCRRFARGVALHLLPAPPTAMAPVWPVNAGLGDCLLPPSKDFVLFGRAVDLSRRAWREDERTGFTFASNPPFYLMRIDRYFNQGVDIKAPLELSRFYFAVQLAVDYRRSGREEHYEAFKSLVLDWIDTNPFPRGIHWLIPMEVAIRAVNWIVAANLIGNRFWTDAPFRDRVSASLLQHANYLDALPEVGHGGHTTNHAAADYTGLLFLALTLPACPKSMRWKARAIEGLEACIRYQVNAEGAHFEGSLSYHRLVLEFFAYSAILCLANGVELSHEYYERLSSMFTHTARYVALDGSAPQVGDNDSGRLLHLQDADEHNHGYLFALARAIFRADPAPWLAAPSPVSDLLPRPLNPAPCSITLVPAEATFHLSETGIHVFRGEWYHLLLSLQPVGMAGQGGHNHIDVGSFTLDLGSKQLVVDPGTFTYTRSLAERQRYRSPGMHNVVVTPKDMKLGYSNGFWDIKNFPRVTKKHATERSVCFTIENSEGEEKVREVQIAENAIRIADSSPAAFSSRIHLHPSIQPIVRGDVCLLNGATLKTESARIEVESYQYSGGYDKQEPATRLVLIPKDGGRLAYSFSRPEAGEKQRSMKAG